jgi:hypothetical protein
MASVMVMQEMELNPSDIEGIRGLLQAHPEWNRTRLIRNNTIRVGIKDVSLHALTPRFRKELCSA